MCCLQVLHAGDLICEGTIRVASEPKPAEAAEPGAGRATDGARKEAADAAVQVVSVEKGAAAQEPMCKASSQLEVGCQRVSVLSAVVFALEHAWQC